MKKIVIALLACSAVYTVNAQNMQEATKPAANAQTDMGQRKPDAQERAAKMTDEMTKNLNLSDEQKLKIMAINVDKTQKEDVIFLKRQEANKAFKEQLDKLEKEKESELQKIITKDQFARYMQEKQERQQQRMMEHPRLEKPAPPVK